MPITPPLLDAVHSHRIPYPSLPYLRCGAVGGDGARDDSLVEPGCASFQRYRLPELPLEEERWPTLPLLPPNRFNVITSLPCKPKSTSRCFRAPRLAAGILYPVPSCPLPELMGVSAGDELLLLSVSSVLTESLWLCKLVEGP